MLQEKIIKTFAKNPKLHLLFYFDETGELETQVKELIIPGIGVELVNHNWLYIQHKYHQSKEGEQVFLYLKMPSPQESTYAYFPLLGLLKANRELMLDDVGELMEDYNLQPHQKGLTKKYRKELGYKQTRDVFFAGGIMGGNFTELLVQQGLLSTFLGFSKPESWTMIIAKMLTLAHPSKGTILNTFSKKINENNLIDVLNKHIRIYFESGLEEVSQQSLSELLQKMKYNSIVQNMGYHDNDPYQTLRIKSSDTVSSLNMIRELAFNQTSFSTQFKEAFDHAGKDVREEEIVRRFGVYIDYSFMTETLVWTIASELIPEIEHNPQKTEKWLDKLLIRISDENALRFTLQFLRYTSSLFKFIESAGSLKLDTPDEYIEKYTKSYYQIDFQHRKSLFFYKGIDFTEAKADEGLKKLKKSVDNRYAKFIDELNHEWLSCLSSYEFDYAKITAPKQYDFHKEVVEGRKQKIAVIISDALRYEIAHELFNELHKDDKNVSTFNYRLASIPSTTSFGMSNLLPGTHYNYNHEGEIRIDGRKTTNMQERENALRNITDRSKTVSFEEVDENTKQINRELFKNEVVYVYHDIIDKTGHKGVEKNVFLDAQRAIEELARMVKLILGGMGVRRVLITADHGFVYTDTEIKERDKNEIAECNTTEKSARHYITSDPVKVQLGYKIPLFKTSKFQEPFYVIIPHAVNRFKSAGSRYQFIHGGGSLQELIVPVIESIRMEESVQHKVNPILLGGDLKIVSNVLKFQLLQENPLSADEKERTVKIQLFASNQLVSESIEITLDATGTQPVERITPIIIQLTQHTSESVLKLKIFDINDSLNPLIEENVKNSTLIGRDF